MFDVIAVLLRSLIEAFRNREQLLFDALGIDESDSRASSINIQLLTSAPNPGGTRNQHVIDVSAEDSDSLKKLPNSCDVDGNASGADL